MKKLLALIILSLVTAVFAQATDDQIVTIQNGANDLILAPADVTVILTADNTWTAVPDDVVTYTNAPGGGQLTVSISINPTTPGTAIEMRATIPNTLAVGTGTVVWPAQQLITTAAQPAIDSIPNGTIGAVATIQLEVQTTDLTALPTTQDITLVYDLN